MCFNSNLYGFEQNGDRMLLNLSGLPTDSEPVGESTSQAGEGGKSCGEVGCRSSSCPSETTSNGPVPVLCHRSHLRARSAVGL